MINKKLFDFVKSRLPLELLQSLDEGFRGGFSEADAYARSVFVNIGPSRPRAQLRNYHINEQLARHGMVQHTTPKGEVYGLLLLQELSVLAFCVAHDKVIRPARFRTELAEMNKVFEPITEDMFNNKREEVCNSLHGCFIIHNPSPCEENQATPAGISFAIPYTDYTGFHLAVSMNDLLESYKEPTTELKEGWPVFREDLIRIEKDDGNGN